MVAEEFKGKEKGGLMNAFKEVGKGFLGNIDHKGGAGD